MEIIVHGRVIKFVCDCCGCVWLASEDEVHSETLFAGPDVVGRIFTSYCPDCLKPDIEGTRIKWKDEGAWDE